MDLREFVATALTQIVAGIQDAQESTTGKGEINPRPLGGSRHTLAQQGLYMAAGHEGLVHAVDFDVAVTVGSMEGAKGGIGLIVGPVTIGAKGSAEAEHSTVSRVKFSVPLVYPGNG